MIIDATTDITCTFFFFNDTATTEIYTLSLHDALPISAGSACGARRRGCATCATDGPSAYWRRAPAACASSRRSTRRSRAGSRSEEHTSELQSRQYLVCRLLLEKKKIYRNLFLLDGLPK